MDEREENLVEEAMLYYWGDRCAETDETCAACRAWSAYDKLTEDKS